jgi:hypothetical protein
LEARVASGFGDEGPNDTNGKSSGEEEIFQ